MKKIKTLNKFYLYDSVTSNILDTENFTEDEVAEALDAVNNSRILETPAYHGLIEAINGGLIQELADSECRFWFDEKNYFDDLRKKKHLLLGVTEICNMRCKYCVYGGHYENERVHSEKIMSYETAIRAVDLFLSTTDSEYVVFNFYGGEPLSNFGLIRRTVEYIDKKCSSYSVVITTNGTLLSDAIIDWFIANEHVQIYISLGGTPDIHDKLRVFKEGNAGTFSRIKQNVMRLKDRDKLKNAYPKRLHFVFNIFSETQLFKIRNFWLTEEMFADIENLPEITMIDCLQDDGYVSTLGEQIINRKDYPCKPLDEYIRLLQAKKYDDIFVSYYDNKFIPVHKRDTDDSAFRLSGICRPFIHKFFVDVDGNINICENFIFENYFGNVHTHFNVQSVSHFLDNYRELRKESCKNCWARKLCSLCPKDVWNTDGSVNYQRAVKMCDNERKLVEHLLTEYCTVLEVNPDLLDHFDDQILVE